VVPRTHLAAADHIDAAGKGRLWVAEAAGQVLGYALYGELDGAAHLEQMDVEPAHDRRGIGRALLECVAARATAEGFERMTSVTLRDVPWNAPFYAGAGFAVLDPAECTPGLHAVLARERRLGFRCTCAW
jgi:GNAT superfamily N-acetyltransferase